ncbi:MAG: transglycosylase protein [Actinomycetia bacterium]|nr:transglycosylase protein [Actinomycetes bacterium]
MLAVPQANADHAAAAVTKLLVGVAVVITFLLGLVMMVSVGILGGSAASPTAQQEVPPNYLALYRSAADTCPGLPWSVLAAIGKVETNHGRLQAPGVTSGANFAGAAGPMQIGIGGKAGNTFGAYAVDGDGDGFSNVYNPADAIFTAASYLCRNGAGKGGDLSRAVFAYNHADWYVTKVLAIASTYEAARPAPLSGGPAAPPNHDVAAIAIQFAYHQLGKPYVWGAEGDNFYDCSGLMQRAYKEAGVQLPRTSREQWYAGARVLDPGDLQPGDLVFGARNLSDPGTIYHVGMYIGAGNMIVAPYTGAVVRIQPMIRNDYIGAVRPTAAA